MEDIQMKRKASRERIGRRIRLVTALASAPDLHEERYFQLLANATSAENNFESRNAKPP